MRAEKVIGTLTARWRRAGHPDFAWWIPLLMDGFACAAGAVAVGQRSEQGALLPATLLGLVALTPWFLDFAGIRMHWLAFMTVTIAATSVLMARYPVDYDFAMLVWVLMVGHIGASETLVRSLMATTLAVVALGLLAMADLVQGSAFWLAGLIVGGDIGVIMRYQQVRLDEQARAHRDHEAAAVLQERQRIAREVHDVVAHSLSVTMLHLTAARRSLEEDRETGIDDAVDALRDAENLGREAMADIRTTVGLLGQEPGLATAAPDLRDLPALVDDFRQAGLRVNVEIRGDTGAVPPNACLGLYRIVQESLANVAKHEPRSGADVLLDCGREELHLLVSNELAAGSVRQPGGNGLKGMHQRAELLGGSFHAGPEDGRWVVEVTLGGHDLSSHESSCPLGLKRAQPSPGPA
jgi:signal transduction histidine kinase